MSIQPLPSERRPRPRIETLADLVFGLSLSIGAIGLIASAPTTQSEINSHIYAFGFTFLVLITAWIIYTTYMSVLPGRRGEGHHLPQRGPPAARRADSVFVEQRGTRQPLVESGRGVRHRGVRVHPLRVGPHRNHADPGGLRSRHQHRREESRRARTGSTLPQREEPLGDPIAPDGGVDRPAVLGVDSLRRADPVVHLVPAAHLVLGRPIRPAAEPDVPDLMNIRVRHRSRWRARIRMA